MPEPSARQIAMVIDLNKCMGCQTCTVACKVLRTNNRGMDHVWWMKVNTVPGRGYPRDWERRGGGYVDDRLMLGERPTAEEYGGLGELPYQRVFFGGEGSRAHLAPPSPPAWGPNWDEDIGGGTYPNAYFFYLPRLCNHCSRPSCAEACPLRAITKNADGIVTIDQSACPSCADPACVAACPYKEITYDSVRRVAWKCDLCIARLEDGVAPACVRQCPGRNIWIDYLDNTEGAIHKLVRDWEVALPLHAEYGTVPHVYYIPPLAPPALDAQGDIDLSRQRIPSEELRRVFGPRVDVALQTLERERERRRTGESALMDILVAPRWQALLGQWGKDPSEAGSA